MKKVLLVSILILSIFAVGCNDKSDSIVKNKKISKSKSESISFLENSNKDRYNYTMKNESELIKWLKKDDSKLINNGAFDNLIDLYINKEKAILVPVIENNSLNNIFVDSNNNFINYVFTEPSIRVCIEPIDTDGNKGLDTKDIRKFTEQKYKVQLNEEEAVPFDEQVNSEGIDTGYEYDTYVYIPKKVKFGDEKKDCVLKKKFSEKSDTEYQLLLIEKERLIRIFYYDNRILKNFEKITFEEKNI